MIAGRSSWLCHGTTPPGWITSRRMRSLRSLSAIFSLARSIEPITVSVTPLGLVAPGFWPSATTLLAGHCPALAPGEISASALTKAAVSASFPRAVRVVRYIPIISSFLFKNSSPA